MSDNNGDPRSPSGQRQGTYRDVKLDALIGNKLRSYYDELLAEPVPSRIMDLLLELEAKENADQADKSK